MLKFTFEEDLPKKKPLPRELTKAEWRQDLINNFLSRKNELDQFLNEYIEFLQLENLYDNEIDRLDLKTICDNIKLGLGGIDEAWELIYAFNARKEQENNMDPRP